MLNVAIAHDDIYLKATKCYLVLPNSYSYPQATPLVSPKVVPTIADLIFDIVKLKSSASATATKMVSIHRIIIVPCKIARATSTVASVARMMPA